MFSMHLLAQTDVSFILAKPPRALAVSGAALGLIAMMVAVGAPAFFEATEAPHDQMPHVLAESAHRIKDRLAHKEMDVAPERRLSWKSVPIAGAALAGFLAAAMGTASWVRREHLRLSSIAIAAGLTAIAWNYFVVAAIAAGSLFLLAWVVSHFHR